MPIDDLKFEEVIGWSVWETFNDDALTGWMKDLPSVLSLSNEVRSQDQKGNSLHHVLNQSIECIARENFINQQ
jgi:hypothetical protein